MPTICEILGYPTEDRSPTAESSRRSRLCPYTGRLCDGGGNRNQSVIRLDDGMHDELRAYFGGADSVHAGVCSIRTKLEEPPWIVCPNRLVSLGEGTKGLSSIGKSARDAVLDCCGFLEGTHIGVWRELSFNYKREVPDKGIVGDFKYRLDYLLMPLATVRFEDAVQDVGMLPDEFARLIECGGHSVITRRGERYIEKYPQGAPVLVELMTCSTSGGNKQKRTQIAQAFEDCILRGNHNAPSINQRQVVGRMITQLLVKSQASLHWGGRTVWVLQDRLVDYISATTALDLGALKSDRVSEVNMLALSYGDRWEEGTRALGKSNLYSDLINDDAGERPSFRDVLLGAVFPPRSLFIQKLLSSQMSGEFVC